MSCRAGAGNSASGNVAAAAQRSRGRRRLAVTWRWAAGPGALGQDGAFDSDEQYTYYYIILNVQQVAHKNLQRIYVTRPEKWRF